jgi:plastocyanin
MFVFRRFTRFILILFVCAFVVLAHRSAHAASVTWTILAGSQTFYGIDILAFGPQSLRVHRGDTVTWKVTGFHNIRFDVKPADYTVNSQVDGKAVTELNPVIAFPNAKTGDLFKPGLSTGILRTSAEFSVLMDIPPGTYTYVCDIHPGMIAIIEVVEDQVELPNPESIKSQSEEELKAAINVANLAIIDRLQNSKTTTAEGPLQVSVGAIEGLASINRNYPQSGQIIVGQSIVWTVPLGFEQHSVNFPIPAGGYTSSQKAVKDTDGKPHQVFTDVVAANVQSGADFPENGDARSGLIYPGQSFSLRFTKPGVYTYFCALHPDQIGTIRVNLPPTPAPTVQATQSN